MDELRLEARTRLERLRQYLQSDPSNAGLALELAQVSLQAGEPAAGAEALARVLAAGTGTAQHEFLLGTCLLAAGNYTQAAATYEAMSRSPEVHPAIRYNHAYALMNLGSHDKVCEALDLLQAQEWASVPEAHVLYARACHHLERYEDGVSHLQQYLKQQPNDATAWGQLALLLFDDNQQVESLKAAERALQLNPDETNALLARGGEALERQDAAQAESDMRAVIAVQTQNGRAWSGLAYALMLKLQLVPAKTAFLEAVRYMPDHIGTWHGLAWLQILENDLDGAEQSFEKAMAIDRNFGETHGGLAVVNVLKGNAAAAEKMSRRGLGLNPSSFAARYANSLALSRGGRGTEAQQLINSIVASASPDGAEGFQKLVANVLSKAQAAQADSGQASPTKH